MPTAPRARIGVWSGEPAVISRVSSQLRPLGVSIEGLESSEEVMAGVLDDRIDVLIADLGAVSPRRVAALRNLKRVRPRLPVIVLAAVFDERFRQEVMPLGVYCHLLPDGEEEELLQAARSALTLASRANPA